MPDQSGNAFPMTGAAGPNGHYCWPEPGFTKREEIAARQMAVMRGRADNRLSTVDMAKQAVADADMLLRALHEMPEGWR